MEKEKKGKLVLFATGSRTLSTVFTRVTLQLPNLHFIVGKLPHFAVANHFNFKEGIIDKLFEEIEKEIDEQISLGKIVIWKDITLVINQFYSIQMDKIIKKYNPEILHMIRHPKPQFISFKKEILNEISEIPEVSEMESKILRMSQVKESWYFYEKYKGYIIITEELQEFPEEVFKKAYDYIGLIFNKSLLEFEPLESDVTINISNFPFLKSNWYKAIRTSTCFKSSKPDVNAGILEEEWEENLIKESIPYYDLFVEESKKGK